MPPRRVFLGWDRAVPDRVAERLLPRPAAGPNPLDDRLVVVPTRQAARRLREALARRAAAAGGGVTGARVVPPTALILPEGPAARTLAPPAVVQAVWMRVLMDLPIADYTGFFPVEPPMRDRAWALAMGSRIQALRSDLLDAGLTLAEVPPTAGEVLEEPERWRDLARLEEAFIDALTQAGFGDPVMARLNQARSFFPPEGVRKVVLAAVPDPVPLLVQGLDRFVQGLDETVQPLDGSVQGLDVEVWIAAPEAEAEAFDAWGRPRPEVWGRRALDLPEPVRAASAIHHARVAVGCLAEADAAPSECAVGAADSDLIPHLAATLTEQGLRVFDPSDRPLANHALGILVGRWADAVADPSWATAARLARTPEVLNDLAGTADLAPGDLLARLDEAEAEHLPTTVGALLDVSTLDASLVPALARLHELTDVPGNPAAAVRDLLVTRFGARELGDAEADREFAEAATAIGDLLSEIEQAASAGADARTQVDLLRHRLREARLPAPRGPADLVVEGWLELAWLDTPWLVAAGIHEGAVPDTRVGDAFLPDGVRQALGLRHDAQRLARDAYLLTLLREMRRERGRLWLTVGRTDSEGNPVRPSRLWFRVPDENLVARVKTLFADVTEPSPARASTVSFGLDTPVFPPVRKISVTGLRSYLECPFRFGLRAACGWSPVDPAPVEPDALAFGSLIHAALERLGDAPLVTCADAGTVASALEGALEAEAEKRYGRDRTAETQVVLDAARARLRAAAALHAAAVAEGWEIVETESKLRMDIGGIVLSGVIDRVERHRETGHLRVLDYKTSDKGDPPAKMHLRNRREDTPAWQGADARRRWTDLQLPAYLLLWEARRGVRPDTAGYVLLPAAVGDTRIGGFEELGDELMASARTTIEAICRKVAAGEFWPPGDVPADWDPFGRLFPEGVTSLIEMHIAVEKPRTGR